jgi:hypothetical protein
MITNFYYKPKIEKRREAPLFYFGFVKFVLLYSKKRLSYYKPKPKKRVAALCAATRF